MNNNYYLFQQAGIDRCAAGNTLLADEMGTGKTIQALGTINKLRARDVLIICPASLKLNWQQEALKWLDSNHSPIWISENGASIPASPQIVITNYERIDRISREYRTRQWDMMIVDEAHLLKNPKTIRFKKLIGRYRINNTWDGCIENAKHILFLTGTPMPNSPIDVHALASTLNPHVWRPGIMGRRNFKSTYLENGENGLIQLNHDLRSTVMLRRTKQEVLPELPAKLRQIIPIQSMSFTLEKERMAAERILMDIQHLRKLAEKQYDKTYATTVQHLKFKLRIAFTEISRLRHQTAIEKLPAMIEYIEMLKESVKKLVIFGYHLDVIDSLAEAIGCDNIVTGQESLHQKQDAIDRFQQTDDQFIIGSIGAMGNGHTLTAGSVALFVEEDWTPAKISQAEDRLARIGQRNNVLIQHLVVDGSLDARMCKVLLQKQGDIDLGLGQFSLSEMEIILRYPEMEDWNNAENSR